MQKTEEEEEEEEEEKIKIFFVLELKIILSKENKKDLYYIGYPTATEGVYVCVVNDKQQVSMVTVKNENLNDWDKTNFANGELLTYSVDGNNWYLCVFPEKHEAMNSYAMFQQAHKAGIVNLDRRIKVTSVQDTLKELPVVSF